MAALDFKQIKNSPVKQPVRAVETTALPTNTYANGAFLGYGATLTATANGVLTVDGVTVALGDRILVTAEAAPANNGIYVVTTLGTASVPYVLTRATDADTNVKVYPGIQVQSTGDGTANKNESWELQNTGTTPLTIGTTAQTWGKGVDGGIMQDQIDLAASTTTANGQLACATALASTPLGGGYVSVYYLGGTKVRVGNGVTTDEAYWSTNSGVSALAFSALVSGALLYWNGSVSGFNLSSTGDTFDFIYIS